MFNFFKSKTNEAREELANVITFKEVYDNDSLGGVDSSLPLYYLKLRNDEMEIYNSTICLCKSEFVALKTIYQVKYSYSTKKVYSLESEPSRITILDEVQTTLQEVFSNEKLKSNFRYRLDEGVTPYTKKDLKNIDAKCELIWDMYSRKPMCIVKRGDGFVLPKDALSSKSNMPFGLSGGSREMIDKNGKYGIINSGDSLKNDLKYKLLYPFEYHYIRLDGFGNAELLKDEIVHGGDYKKLVCTMVNLWDEKSEPKQVLLNSTTRDEYITIDDSRLLTQHTKNGFSKPYQTIMQRFLSIKPVQDINGLWGYIDKDANEIIACKFKDWNFFNNGYAVLEENNKSFIIDAIGNIIIDSLDFVEHYKDDMYFVNRGKLWGVFKKGELYIDFCDKKPIELVEQMQNKKRELHAKMYELPLKEYMTLFDTPQKQNDLIEMGLWDKKVSVKECEIITRYKEILKDPSFGVIGYYHQIGAGVYAMDIELPVIFEKQDGSAIALGIGFENLAIQ
ncbi:MAG: WG repeat-containing protein [Sulfurimonas sp.]|uniref:WG repeat-containing protein n=1 Tax=Sulfurimonas sp. TaxID=2022749 RepID=UPI0026310F8E|nr:WG repeat-containing protein [Sulfurimonas sp.]MDD2652219.1 WG repeat-containing protein [Sulfurimonas sp.]MDD3450499.1 WG repeat-containing protein [Sulfurimonas sp.]